MTISEEYFVQPLIDVVRIQFTFNRALTNTALSAQLELLGCAEGKCDNWHQFATFKFECN